jgi:hypothetical protein
MENMKTNLIIDGNNILYRTFHANNKSGDPDNVIVGVCIHSALDMMSKYFNLYNVDDVIITFDDYSWRKEYTKDLSKCVTNKKYKGHRRSNQTPKEQRLYQMLDDHITEFRDILRDRTSVVVLSEKYLEGDDLMAAYVQMHQEDKNIVLSGDKDMMQLLRYDNVMVIDPATGNERSLRDWENDADLFLFEKCIRGETKMNDNIQSSYPRLRRDKIMKAHHDEYLKANIMDHKFTQLEELPNGEYGDVEYKTEELFKENKVLMDLTAQPKVIKKLMVKTVLKSKENRGRYNHLKFLRFCTVNELTTLINRIENLVPMLTVNP